jgi:hypothetical protein
LGLLAVTCITHAVFFGDDRYHVMISPVLCLLAAAALRPPARKRQASTFATIDSPAASQPA